VEAIMLSVALQERRHSKITDGSRRERIAPGSGTTAQDMFQLVKNSNKRRKG
jgi:signal recognition particle subunit SRP54